MKRKTRSILQELSSIAIDKDHDYVIESRGDHIINSAINLINMIRETYDEEAAKDLENRLLNSIRGQDSNKFKRGVKRIKESK